MPVVCALCLALFSSVAWAAPKDKAVIELAESAMNEDYVSTDFKGAEKKLQRALKTCGTSGCSPKVKARVYRDLGVVRWVGLQQKDRAREALGKAVQVDPSITLDPNYATPELEKAFEEIGGAEVEEVTLEEEDSGPKPDESPKEPDQGGSGERPQSLVSLGFQLDLLYYSTTTSLCENEQFTCYDVNQEEYTGEIWDEYGNQIPAGLGLATRRILIGYDRGFGDRLMLGARLGYAFNGGPTPESSGDAFLPLHAELRATYFLSGSRVIHLWPFATLALGVAEVDGHIPVDYYENQAAYNADQQGTLDAWRKTGKTFVSPGVGALLPVGPSGGGVVAELRALFMLGAGATGLAVGVGYAHGL